MIIAATSDFHGQLPIIEKCDVLVIGGDICPVWNHKLLFQASWLDTVFRKWLKQVPAKHIIGIAGNHDLIFEKAPHLVPQLPWTYLQDSSTTIDGLTFYGSPWSLNFSTGWVFNASEEELDEKYGKIPGGCDIIISHDPPFGCGDIVCRNNENVGSKSLLKHIKRIKPQLVACGHIHEGYGEFKIDDTIVANVSYVDERYVASNPPIYYSIVGNNA